MLESRSLFDLLPSVQEKASQFATIAEARGKFTVLFTATFRDAEMQNFMFASGRSRAGHIITDAVGGDSIHQYRRAWDCYPCIGGKPLWNVFLPDGTMLQEWKLLAEVAAELEIEWAGAWKKFREYAHFQILEGLTLTSLKQIAGVKQNA